MTRLTVASAAAECPPKPCLALTVGIVGHRPKDLAKDETHRDVRLKKVANDIKESLAAIAEAADRVQKNHRGCFCAKNQDATRDEEEQTRAAAMLTLVSALAEGADTIAAKTAIDVGYALDVVLPFASAEYERDFTRNVDSDADAATAAQETREAINEFRSLLKRARSILELPGQRRSAGDSKEDGDLKENRAYEAVGLTVLSNADILLAVWDRQLSRGRGGTADMIAEAARAGIPIVLVDARGERPIEVRWRNLMPLPAPVIAVDDLPARSLPDCVHQVIDELVRLPAAAEQREGFDRWFAERRHRVNLCIGYPFVTMGLLVRLMRRGDVAPRPPSELALDYVRDAAPVVTLAAADRIKWLAEPYGWADAVGLHFAQVFRSAFVTNFIFAALAVVFASASVMIPRPGPHESALPLWSWPNLLVAIEIFLVLCVVGTTIIGRSQRWHGRWVEAREVAERLRAALPLWTLGLRPAFFPGEEPTWTGWYARAVVRMQGLRSGNLGQGQAPERKVLLNLLVGQCDYNRMNSKRMRSLNRRLEGVGLCLLAATLVFAVDHLLRGPLVHCTLGFFLPADEAAIWLSAALPALATATYGIRIIGDFEGTAHRAERTHRKLDQLIATIKQDPPDLGLLRARTRTAANAMLGDVSSWRLSAESRGLAIPG